MNNTIRKPSTGDGVKEGAAEISERFKSDLSRWMKLRNNISLKPIINCKECDGIGKYACATCNGQGFQNVMMSDEKARCSVCDGTGKVTCIYCSGKGLVDNPYQKPLKWTLIIGGVAILLVLLQMYFMNHDLVPGLGKKGGGGSISTGAHTPASSPSMAPQSNNGLQPSNGSPQGNPPAGNSSYGQRPPAPAPANNSGSAYPPTTTYPGSGSPTNP